MAQGDAEYFDAAEEPLRFPHSVYTAPPRRHYLRAPDFGHRIYRIGWMVSPPFAVRDANGDATGIAIDLLKLDGRPG